MAVKLAHLDHAPQREETAPPLLIAHGLFGSARNFNTLGRRLARNRRVVMVDMRNHGASPHDPRMDYSAMAGDLAEAIERLCSGQAAVLGHSMGGKAAMALALSHPEGIERLVVADIAPVAYRHSHRSYLAAMRAVDLADIRRRSDADPMLAEAVPEAPLRSFILQNLVVEGGEARWRLNLDALAGGMDALLSFPDDLPHQSWEGPALFIHGSASDYVAPETHDAIRSRFPSARVEALPGAGHWLHAEQPEAFLAAVSAWLDEGQA